MAPRNADLLEGPGEDELDLAASQEYIEEETMSKFPEQPRRIVWMNVVWYIFLHGASLYGLWLSIWAHPLSWAWGFLTYCMSALGITAGAHRLWSHRSFKAKTPLRIFLAVCQTMALQNDIIEWVRDHRVHHKYSETNADPHNAKRGFFFSHIGWLMVRKHPAVKEKGKLLDLSDVKSDVVCKIQRMIYRPAALMLCIVLPTVIPNWLWGESLMTALFISILRYTLVLNATWAVNSVAHIWGNKPYDQTINPVENAFVVFGAIGEGFHNYHHTFPYDYRTSEYGWKFNITTAFINSMKSLGLATACKTASNDSILNRKKRTGDGSTGFGKAFPSFKLQ